MFVRWYYQAGIALVVLAVTVGGGYLAATSASRSAGPALTTTQDTGGETEATPPRPPTAADAEIQRLKAENERLRTERADEAERAAAARKAPESGRQYSIRGGAWLVRKNGDSIILRGLKIVLLPAQVPPEALHRDIDSQLDLVKIFREGQVILLQRAFDKEDYAKYQNDVQKCDRDMAELIKMKETITQPIPTLAAFRTLAAHAPFGMPAFASVADSSSIHTAVTDIDGKFVFSEIAPGTYYVYASFFAESAGAARWIVPVEVNANKEVDLYNENAEVIRSLSP